MDSSIERYSNFGFLSMSSTGRSLALKSNFDLQLCRFSHLQIVSCAKLRLQSCFVTLHISTLRSAFALVLFRDPALSTLLFWLIVGILSSLCGLHLIFVVVDAFFQESLRVQSNDYNNSRAHEAKILIFHYGSEVAELAPVLERFRFRFRFT
jgi:hypothetical protein